MPYKNIVIKSGAPTQLATDQKTQFYMGFSTVNNSNIGNKLYDFELIKQDIINYFNTRKGERVMNPGYGCLVWDLLFEPLTDDTLQAIQSDIMKICESDPRAYVVQLDIREYDKGFLVELTLGLTETDQTSNMKVSFDQEIGLSVQ
jgi:phage baseplate assembly protein W